MQINIDQIKNRIIPLLKEAGVNRCSVFGSYARGENDKDSDLDLLVEISKNKTLFDIVALKLKLEEILGKKVDLVEYETIKPALKEIILNNQLPIYQI